MSQTIEELMTKKQQELGLNQDQLEALKDYSTKVSKLIDANKALLNDPYIEQTASQKKMDTAMKTSSGVVKSVSVGADVSIYRQQGDSLAKAIVKAIVDVATSETIDTLATLGFGKSANLAEYAINIGGVVVDFKTPGDLAAEDAVKWTDWAFDYYVGPNVKIDRTKVDTLEITSLNGSISHILHDNWDGNWYTWFNFAGVKYLKDVSNWIIKSGENGDNETIEFKNNSLLKFTGYRTDRAYDHLTEVLGYLAQKGVEHIDVSLNGGSARALTSFIGHINGMEDGSWLVANASNQKVFYALQTLKGYVFDTNVANGSFNQVESKLFSDKYIQDRAKFTALVINENLSAEGKENVKDYLKDKKIVYQDLSQNIELGNDTTGRYTKVVFTGNNSENYRESGWITYRVYGGDGSNVLHTANMNDHIEGGEGSDTIYSYDGDDTIYTNANLNDNDYDLEDAGTTNTVYAGDGEDKIYGSVGKDVIYADSDNAANPNQYDNKDLVEGRGGSDKIYGGNGRDTLYADSAASHADTSGDYIVGGLGADTIHGSDGNDTIYGDEKANQGNNTSLFSDSDTIYAYDGNDTVYGGNDSDIIEGGTGSDTIYGGDDDDILYAGRKNQNIDADDGTRIDDGTTNYLSGGEGDDTLWGGSGDDTLDGGADEDRLRGGLGFDTYQAGDGDTIMDSDHQGKVFLAGHLLTGGSSIQGENYKYKGDYGEIYTLDTIHDTLHVELEDEEITIKNYDEYKQSLGIALGKKITVTLDDAKVNEGDTMSIGVHIDTTLSQDITICIMTGEESASENKDYIGFGENSKPYGEVTIKAGESVGYMKIPILKDTLIEEDETFYIIPTPDPSLDTTRYPLGVKYNGSDLALVTFANAGVGTILDGESKDVVITFHDVKVNEDTGKMTFSITSNTTLKNDLVIDVMSIDGSTKAGSDYVGVEGQAIIQAGETAGTFSVDILNDDTPEEDETLILSPLSYTYTGDDMNSLLFENTAEGTIVDDDYELKDIEITIANATADEKEGTITFDITLNKPLDEELSFGVMTIDGSAKEGEDYVGEETGLVTIAAKSTTGTFSVALKSDNITESPETFILSPTGGFGYNGNDLGSLLFMNAGEGTITDKKDIIITLEDASANEQEGYIGFKININERLNEDFSFKVQSIDGSATGGSDYEAQNANVVTIKAGSREITHTIQIASDGIYEKSEEFMLYAYSEADSYSGNDLGKVTFAGTALGTITDTKAPQSCPAPITPDFGFSFDVPLAPIVSAGGNYSSGGGGSYYYTGRTSSAPRVYNPSTPTITPPQPLPNVPVYECHYTLELSSVALVTLPTACSTPPLVLDLNRDGITSLSLATSLALFDYDNDGVKEHTAWIQNSDALLVRDINDDGVISDGSELFGDKTLKQDGTLANDGYDALKEYDTNDDGVINSLDDKFNELKLWMDDGDGITQEGELHTLTQENITSISLPTTTMTPIKENGNTITNTSTYTKDDGTLGDVKDIWFEYENIAEETYFDMDGDGFAEKMETWMEANQGVLVWDKNGDGIINSGKEILSNHMLLPNGKTLSDSFSGLNAFDTNKDGVIDTQDSAGLAIWKDTNKNGQTDAGELLAFGDENSLQSINLNPYQNMLSGYDRNHDMKLNSSDAIYNYMYEQENADGSITLYIPNNTAAKNMLGDYSGVESIETSQGTKTLKEVIFYTGELTLNDTLQGTTKNDKLIGNKRANYLFGGDGRDIIEANDGNDTLEGGSGDDWLKGGNSNDVYVFGKGDGVDVIEDSSGTDVLKLKEGVTQEDVIIRSNGTDINVTIKGNTPNTISNQIILKNWYNTNTRIEGITFADGTIWGAQEIISHLATEGNDKIYGSELGDVIDGLAGDDALYGMQGDDTLTGGVGDDMLGGSLGNDTYVFVRGDGSDIIEDTGGVDKVVLKDIASEDLHVSVYGDHMKLTVYKSGTSEIDNEILLQNWYREHNRIEQIVFDDGTIWQATDLVSKLASDGDDTIIGTPEDDVLYGEGGEDTLYGLDGDDTLAGGIDADLLYGSSGNDVYQFNKGDGKDRVIDSAGDDTLVFGEGIGANDIIFKQSRYDLIVAIKQDGIAFDDLEDSITLSNWFKNDNSIETFVFHDGSSLSNSDIAANFTAINIEDTIFADSGAVLRGEDGDDTYVYNRGDKIVVIDDIDYSDDLEINAGNDTLILSTGLTQQNTHIGLDGNHLVIQVKNEDGSLSTQDMVVIKDWTNVNRGIEKIIYSDGSSVELSRTDALDAVSVGSAWASSRYFIYGNEDNEINGSSANETFDGGGGNDFLKGGSGDDVYQFGRGSGKDTIYDVAGVDTIRFGVGLTKDDIVLRVFDGNLAIALKEGTTSFTNLSDRIIIKDWMNSTYRIEKFQFDDGSVLSDAQMISFSGTEEDDIITAFTGSDDSLNGKGGNDTLNAGDGNDTLDGGIGNDLLYGNTGDDTYLFKRGGGVDTVEDISGIDKILVDDNITIDQAEVQRVGDDLVIGLKEDGIAFEDLSDKMIVKNWFTSLNNRIEIIQFTNGRSITANDILKATSEDDTLEYGAEDDVVDALAGDDLVYGGAGNDTIDGNEGNDNLQGQDGEDVLSGGNGNDVLYGQNDNDTLNGDAGNDTLYGQAGNDTLNGGEGNDNLHGQDGDDVYLFNRGDGLDTINEHGSSGFYNGSLGNDTLKLGEGISVDDVILKQSGNHLIVGIKEDGKSFNELSDKITLYNWLEINDSDANRSYSAKDYYNRIENIEFADGTTWDTKTILANTHTDDNDSIYGFRMTSTDILTGGKGDDTLYGRGGDDTYLFNRGDGHDTIVERYGYYYQSSYSGWTWSGDANGGSDTLKFGEGIGASDIIMKKDGNNLIVALKEDDVAFENLTDTVTINDWYNTNHRVENIELSDGTVMDLDLVLRTPTEFADQLELGAEDNVVDALAGDDLVYGGVGNDTIDGNEGNDNLQGQDGEDVLSGGNGNDTLYGGNSNDTINGDAGNDTLYGQAGNDTLNGGIGNDMLYGDYGDDVYIYNRGDGVNTIYDYDSRNSGRNGGNETLLFGEGITQDDLILKQVGYNLVITLKEEGKSFDELSDKVVITNFSYNDTRYYESGNNYNARFGIENFEFSDGTSWTTADMMSHIRTDGDDVIYGLDGADTLEGGKGDDTLYGRLGNDTYVFNRGDGKDIILDDYGTYEGDSNSGSDTLKFGEGIGASDIIMKKDANNLIVALKEDGIAFENLSDTITMREWYNPNNRIESIELSDGTVMDLDLVLRTPTEFADRLEYGAEDNVVDALAGDDLVYGGAGNDTIDGNEGNDNLQGQDGEDVLSGGNGNDVLYGQNDNDTLNGDAGNDTLWGNYGADSLKGGNGDDTLYGDYEYTSYGYTQGYADTLEGGLGNDTLKGGSGDDIYIFNRGDGKDYIYDNHKSSYYGAWTNGGNDTLCFGEGITQEDLILKQNGNQLIVALKEEGKSFDELSDKITLENFSYNTTQYKETQGNYNAYFGIENFEFSDGSSWTTADMMSHIGTDGDDVIYGLDGADTLEGGKGNDTLYGRLGNDTYVFNRGDGKDIIFDDYGTYNGDNNSGSDTLKFGEGISASDIVFWMDGANLKVDIGDGDSITINS